MEKKIYILCHEENSNEMLRAFDAAYGTHIADGEVNCGVISSNDLQMEVIAYGNDLGEESTEFIRKQINSVCGYLASIETEHVDIKINALHQIMRSKGFIFVKYTYEGEENKGKESLIIKPMLQVLPRVKGLVLINDGLTLLNEEGKVILTEDGKSQLQWFMPYERPVGEDFFQGAPEDALRHRNESLAKIKERHIHVTEWLPLIESEADAHFRSAEEIAGRAAALLIVALYSRSLLGDKKTPAEAREYVSPVIAAYGAENYFSEKEKAYLENDNSTQQEQIQFVWQYEPLLVMLWALGYEEELFFPDRICDVDKDDHIMFEHNSIEALVKDAKLRNAEELLSEADMIYRLDWACVDTRIHGLPAPAGMDGGVVMERHKALNWLIQDVDWDDVDIST